MNGQVRDNTSAPSSSSSSSPNSSITPYVPQLCVNQCGFYGASAQQPLCSKCFKQLSKQPTQAGDISSSSSSSNSSTTCDSLMTPDTDNVISIASSTLTENGQTEVQDNSTMAEVEGVLSSSLLFSSSSSVSASSSSSSSSSSPSSSSSSSLSNPALTVSTILTSLSLSSPACPSDSPMLPAAPQPSPASTLVLDIDGTQAEGDDCVTVALPVSVSVTVAAPAAPASSSSSLTKKKKNRCSFCSVKVGLTYFSCLCDSEAMFCSAHRYPHAHHCTYNHRQRQQTNLSKNNPVVSHDKLERI